MRNTFKCVSIASTLILTSCDPSFQSTAQLCETLLPTTQVTQSYQVDASTGYKLYFEDFLNSIASLSQDTTLTTDEEAVLDFIYSTIDDYMSYQRGDDGRVTGADNPLDYIESVYSTTDPDVSVLTFSEARENMASAVEKDDGICSYRNSQIVFQQESGENGNTEVENKAFTELILSYIPTAFVDEADRSIDQSFVLTFDTDFDNEDTETERYFGGTARYQPPENFSAQGYVQPNERALNIQSEANTQRLTLVDNYEDESSTLFGLIEPDELCLDDNRAAIDCPEGSDDPEDSEIRLPQHPYCAGEETTDEDEIIYTENGIGYKRVVQNDLDGNPIEDGFPIERNRVITHSFSIGSSAALEKLKRFRAEIDYTANTLKIYVSKFSNAIVSNPTQVSVDSDDADNPQINPNFISAASTDDDIIVNPTSCEQQAVSLERLRAVSAMLNDDEELERLFPDGVSPTVYTDPGFDDTLDLDVYGQPQDKDEDGSDDIKEPATPIFTFTLDNVVPRTNANE